MTREVQEAEYTAHLAAVLVICPNVDCNTHHYLYPFADRESERLVLKEVFYTGLIKVERSVYLYWTCTNCENENRIELPIVKA